MVLLFLPCENDRSYRLAATAPLLNPVAPVDFFVTDRGFLITLDNWHNLGYGKVVAFYTAELKSSYEASTHFQTRRAGRAEIIHLPRRPFRLVFTPRRAAGFQIYST